MSPRLRGAGASSKRAGTQSTLRHGGSSRAQHYQPLTLRFAAGGTKISPKPWHRGFMLNDLRPSLAKEGSWFCRQEKSIYTTHMQMKSPISVAVPGGLGMMGEALSHQESPLGLQASARTWRG